MNHITEQKIANAVKYFIKNTKHCGLTKLFKLLYFLDFMFIKKHGIRVTMLDYYAFPFGPVPKVLYESINTDTLPEYLKNVISFKRVVEEDDYDQCPKYKIDLIDKKVDYSFFTPYEKEMLEEVAFIFKEVTAQEISEISHLPNQPWDRTKNTKGMQQLIDVELAFDEESGLEFDEIHEYIQLQNEQNN